MIMDVAELKNNKWYQNFIQESEILTWSEIKNDSNRIEFIAVNRKVYNFENSGETGVLSIRIPTTSFSNLLMRHSQNFNSNIYYLDANNNVIGVVEKFPLDRGTMQSIRSLLHTKSNNPVSSMGIKGFKLGIFLEILSVLLLSEILALLMARTVVTRLDLFIRKVNSYKQDHLAALPAIKGNDEIAELDMRFKEMMDRIREAYAHERKLLIGEKNLRRNCFKSN